MELAGIVNLRISYEIRSEEALGHGVLAVDKNQLCYEVLSERGGAHIPWRGA